MSFQLEIKTHPILTIYFPSPYFSGFYCIVTSFLSLPCSHLVIYCPVFNDFSILHRINSVNFFKTQKPGSYSQLLM